MSAAPVNDAPLALRESIRYPQGVGITGIRERAATLLELTRLLRTRERWWLIPLFVALVAGGGVLLFAVSQSPVAPFIYTVF